MCSLLILLISIFIVYQVLRVWSVRSSCWHVTVIDKISCESLRVDLSGLSLNLIELVALVLLDHHVDSFLGVLKVKFVELTSIGWFVFVVSFIFGI